MSTSQSFATRFLSSRTQTGKTSRMVRCQSFSFIATLFSLVLWGAMAAAEDAPTGTLCEGTIYSTPWFTIESGLPGPTVLLTGGVHGNEPSGSAAAEQIRHWKIEEGKLIVIPRVNRLGLAAAMRWLPPERNNNKLRDLNRNFPTAESPQPRTELAIAVWEFVQEIKPDYVVDLHEGFDFHVTTEKSVGSSVIFTTSTNRTKLGEEMLTAVNATITDESRKFVPLSRSGAVVGSLVRACQDVLKIDGFILETTFKDQPLSLRTRQHRLMVSTLFQNIGLLSQDLTGQLAPPKSTEVIQVGLFDGAGASQNGIDHFREQFGKSPRIHMNQIGPAEMEFETLRQFDVLLFPGGSGSKQGLAIGESGRQAIREFAKEGGGLMGVCAGAYLCSSDYDWSLDVINTAVFNKTIDIPDVGKKSMWYRGPANYVQMEFDPAAKQIFARSDLTNVKYHNGPILSKGTNHKLPDYTPLAWFRSEVSHYEPQRGTMVDTPAIITAPFGKGRVLCISPHPEATKGLEPIIIQSLEYLRQSE